MTAAFAACWPCNSGKGDFTLEEIDWQLLAVDDVRSDSSGLIADSPSPPAGRLGRLADLAVRRRGRMVLAWIAALVLISAVGPSLAGHYDADYYTPGSESKAAAQLIDERFPGRSDAGIDVVWQVPRRC